MMNRFQQTKFKSIGEFLDFIPEEEQILVESLRKIIFECIPDCEERLAYNVPYYYRHSRICYLWPASVPWGGVDAGVSIGFCRGNLLPDETGYLEKGNRKEVYTKTFTSQKQIDRDLLKSFLYEAKEIDDRLHRS
jgi:hypothetical protein